MSKSGLADSPLFAQRQATPSGAPPAAKPAQQKKAKKRKPKRQRATRHATTPPRDHDTTLDAMQPRYRDTTVEVVRKAVKEFGKEAATHRFTESEKQDIARIVYTFKEQKLMTSENAITRIAVNFIVADYKENGENSFLARVLRALHE